MMRLNKLNNKGYMLVEIILASALAFGIAYFMLDMTIRLKNKNDDLFVTTLVATDQAIITNVIMRDLYDNSSDFDCNYISISDKKFTYNNSATFYNFSSILSNYITSISYDPSNKTNCSIETEKVTINIPIKVKQLPNEDFSVVINYQFDEDFLFVKDEK